MRVLIGNIQKCLPQRKRCLNIANEAAILACIEPSYRVTPMGIVSVFIEDPNVRYPYPALLIPAFWNQEGSALQEGSTLRRSLSFNRPRFLLQPGAETFFGERAVDGIFLPQSKAKEPVQRNRKAVTMGCTLGHLIRPSGQVSRNDSRLRTSAGECGVRIASLGQSERCHSGYPGVGSSMVHLPRMVAPDKEAHSQDAGNEKTRQLIHGLIDKVWLKEGEKIK